MKNQNFSEYHFISPLSALYIFVSWNLKKATLETRATTATKLHVCPCLQCTEPATPSRGAAVWSATPFYFYGPESTQETHERATSDFLTAHELCHSHIARKQRQHMELTQDGCWFQVKGPVPCWLNVPQPQPPQSMILTKMPKCTHSVYFSKGKSRVIPSSCWSHFGTDLTESAFHPRTSSLLHVSKEDWEL